ncbi:hypothetical protein BD413DRAFT_670032 [Trametes elegans]|nr:hypothetical protein BD413DRAFT_670032 [Trametes elegans]
MWRHQLNFWSDNPEANYIMIEPNVKYMLYTREARANPPTPWYARPPPAIYQSFPLDKVRFLPSRRLQNALGTSRWVQTVGDDLDSFSQVLLHSILLRGKRRRDGLTNGLVNLFSALGNTHPKRLLDWRDEAEQSLWRLTQDILRDPKDKGKEPDGTTVAAWADEFYRLFKVNVSHHSEERALAYSGKTHEGARERAARQYDEYLQAYQTFLEAVEAGFARKEEQMRLQAEQKAEKKAGEAQEALEGGKGKGKAKAVDDPEAESANSSGQSSVEGQVGEAVASSAERSGQGTTDALEGMSPQRVCGEKFAEGFPATTPEVSERATAEESTKGAQRTTAEPGGATAEAVGKATKDEKDGGTITTEGPEETTSATEDSSMDIAGSSDATTDAASAMAALAHEKEGDEDPEEPPSKRLRTE